MALSFYFGFFQLVQGKSPSDAGLLTAPLMAGLIVASVIGGRLVSALGLYKALSVLGLGLAIAGFIAIAAAVRAAAPLQAIEAALVVTGAGLGLVMPNLTVAIQNAVPPETLGVATSAVAFFRSLGGALGVALSGSLLAGRVDALLAVAGSAAAAARRAVAGGAGGIAGLPPELHDLVAAAYRQAIGATFATGAVIAGLGLLLRARRETPLRPRPARQSLVVRSASSSPVAAGSVASRSLLRKYRACCDFGRDKQRTAGAHHAKKLLGRKRIAIKECSPAELLDAIRWSVSSR